jgi:hypothetical protein
MMEAESGSRQEPVYWVLRIRGMRSEGVLEDLGTTWTTEAVFVIGGVGFEYT